MPGIRAVGTDVIAAGRRGRVARVIAAAVTGRDGAAQIVKTAAHVHPTFIRGGLLGLGYPWAAACLGDPSGWPAPGSTQAPDSVAVAFAPRAFGNPPGAVGAQECLCIETQADDESMARPPWGSVA
jgi:hypothetical protein